MRADFQRIRWTLLALATIGIVLLASGTLARSTDSDTASAFERLQARSGNRLDVRWDPQSGVPRFVSGRDAGDRIPYTPSEAERGNPAAIARGFLDENRALFRLTSAGADLATLRVEPDSQLGYAHVRMAQQYKGIPVFGKQLVVHIDRQEQIVAVNGQFTPGIDVPTKAALAPDEAERVAVRDLFESQLDADERKSVSVETLHEQTRLEIYVEGNDKATLTWHVVIMTDTPLGQWEYFVNANRATVVHRFDSGAHDKMRRTFSADNKTSIPGRLLIEEGERSDDEVAQAAHDNAGAVFDYYMKKFKRDSIDGSGMAMVSTVHYGSSLADAQNAAWIGQRKQMIYGDGGNIFKPLSLGLDVVAHEFTHGVTDFTAGLIYQGQSGALNESYSDVFGVLIDGKNWLVGDTVIKSPPFPVPYLRNMEDPTAGGRYDPRDPLRSVGQPGHMREYANLPLTRQTDNGGVHKNSGIPNRAAFLLAQAIGNEKVENIYFRTLTQYLTPDSQFIDALLATVRAAQDLYGPGEAQAVRTAFGGVGLDANAPPATPTPAGTARAATPTPARGTPTPAPPPSAGCTNQIVNGGFESEGQGWIEVSGQGKIIDSELPHSGSRSAWLGGVSEESIQYIYQDVRLPANATKVSLAYWRLVHHETENGANAPGTFWVIIANPNGDALATVEQIPSTDGDDAWHKAEFNIAEFAGKAIRIAFVSENGQGNLSSLFVDDVEMLSCSTGPVIQPTPSAKGIQVTGTIKNSDTGRGIEGAKIFFLKPGISATDAAQDDTVTANEVLTFGVTDAAGKYVAEDPVPRGQQYSIIVIAAGFRPILSDEGVTIPADAPQYFVNATMRPSR